VDKASIENLKRFLFIEDQIKSLANAIARLQSQQNEINKGMLALMDLVKIHESSLTELHFEIHELKNKEEG